MNWRHDIARVIQAKSDALMDACATTISTEFDLPADEARTEIAVLVQPTVDQIIAELMTGRQEGAQTMTEKPHARQPDQVDKSANERGFSWDFCNDFRPHQNQVAATTKKEGDTK